MNFETLTFYFFAAILLFAGLRVITARNPVHAALFLVLAFFTASVIWMLLKAEFLAITLVLVYVGAVTVLFLFVLMMLDIDFEQMRQGFRTYLPLGFGVGAIVVVQMAMVLWTKVKDTGSRTEAVATAAANPGYSNTKELGRLLFTDYVYPFELASVILLVAIVAAVALTLRQRKDTRRLNSSEQIAVKRKDRVRMVSMPSEKE